MKNQNEGQKDPVTLEQIRRGSIVFLPLASPPSLLYCSSLGSLELLQTSLREALHSNVFKHLCKRLVKI
jgi:hypothetical protein